MRCYLLIHDQTKLACYLQVVLGKYFMNCYSYQMHLFVQTYEPGFIMLVAKNIVMR